MQLIIIIHPIPIPDASIGTAPQKCARVMSHEKNKGCFLQKQRHPCPWVPTGIAAQLRPHIQCHSNLWKKAAMFSLCWTIPLIMGKLPLNAIKV